MGRNQPQKEFGSSPNNPSAGDFQLGKVVVWGPVVWGPLGVPRSNNPFHNWILIVQTTNVPGKLRFHNLEMTHHVTVSDVKKTTMVGCCRLKFGAVDFSMATKTDFQSQHEHSYTSVHFWSLLTYVSSSYIEIDNLCFISHSCMYTTKFWRVFLHIQQPKKDNPTKTPSFDDTWFIGISLALL